MYAYYIGSVGDLNGNMILQVGVGQLWSTFEPGTAPILVHPDLDFDSIWGDLFLRNDTTTNIVAMEPGEKIAHEGVFVLALNQKMAKELL